MEEEEKKKTSFVIFYDWEPLFNTLDNEDLGALFRAMIAYEIRGEEADPKFMPPQAYGIYTYLSKLMDINKELWKSRSKSGSKGGKASSEAKESKSKANSKQTSSKPEANVKQNQPKDKDKDKDKDISPSGDICEGANKSPTPERKKIPPTIEMVRAYCLERNSSVDPDYFFNYFEGQGWIKANGQKVKDWQATIRTWENSDKEKQSASKAPTTPITPKKSNAELFEELYKEAAIYDGQNNGSNTPAFFPGIPGTVQ